MSGSPQDISPVVTENIYAEYLQRLIAGDRTGCASTVDRLCEAGAGATDLYLNLFQRSLYAVGEMWEQHQVSVATEHLATAITERLLTSVHARTVQVPSRERSAVIACVAGEHHQVGSRMVADMIELRGWRVTYLGANTPMEDLLQFLDSSKPNVLGLSLSIARNLDALDRALGEVNRAHPQLPILLGGQAVLRASPAEFDGRWNTTIVASLGELEGVITGYECG